MKMIVAIVVFVLVGACLASSRTVRDSTAVDERFFGIDAGPKATTMTAGGDVATAMAKASAGPTATTMAVDGDADTAILVAKMDRLLSVNKEIETKTKGELQATRDAVQTTKNITGMGDWAQVAQVFIFCTLMGYQSRCRMKEAMCRRVSERLNGNG
jgi:hypothetical protein